MNSKLYAACAVAAIAVSSVFAEVTTTNKTERIRIKVADLIRRQGGQLIKPGTYQGRVGIVNRQQKLSSADLELVAQNFAKATGCNIAVVSEEKDLQVKLTVIDSPNDPIILVAPEDHWGKVNVARLTDDLPTESAKNKFFASRARKMIMRGLSLLCGGGSSQFAGNFTNAGSLRELDLAAEQLPVDMLDRYAKYLAKIGVTKRVNVPYSRACHEGWAPAPTNDIQKAIWDKVHTVPQKPIKIKFDPAKGR